MRGGCGSSAGGGCAICSTAPRWGRGASRIECVQAAGSILQLLAPEEEEWDFPTAARVAALRLLVARDEVAAAAGEARVIVDALELI